MHVYLTKAIKKDGELINTENLGYRGVADGDTESYKRKMEANGLRVHLSDDYIGRLIDKDLNTLEH